MKSSEWVELDSSVLSHASYDPETLILKLRFRSGREYHYLPVEKEVWEEFLKAESKGRFFNRHIRSVYHSIEHEPEEED